MKQLTRLCWQSTAALFAWGMLLGSLLLQYGLGLEPCALCILVRVSVLCFALFATLLLFTPCRLVGVRFIGQLGVMLSLLGMWAANLRHLWIQSLPEALVPECGPDIGYLLETLPVADALRTVWTGSGDCAELGPTLLGLGLAGWTLVAIVVLTGLQGMAWYRNFKR